MFLLLCPFPRFPIGLVGIVIYRFQRCNMRLCNIDILQFGISVKPEILQHLSHFLLFFPFFFTLFLFFRMLSSPFVCLSLSAIATQFMVAPLLYALPLYTGHSVALIPVYTLFHRTHSVSFSVCIVLFIFSSLLRKNTWHQGLYPFFCIYSR